jgi:hypothetical protein
MVGLAIHELCIRLSGRAKAFWDHTATRLRAHGYKDRLTVPAGLIPSDRRAVPTVQSVSSEPYVLSAGRHVKDKGLRILPDALKIARWQLPTLRLVLAGQGPEPPLVIARLEELGLRRRVRPPRQGERRRACRADCRSFMHGRRLREGGLWVDGRGGCRLRHSICGGGEPRERSDRAHHRKFKRPRLRADRRRNRRWDRARHRSRQELSNDNSSLVCRSR